MTFYFYALVLKYKTYVVISVSKRHFIVIVQVHCLAVFEFDYQLCQCEDQYMHCLHG